MADTSFETSNAYLKNFLRDKLYAKYTETKVVEHHCAINETSSTPEYNYMLDEIMFPTTNEWNECFKIILKGYGYTSAEIMKASEQFISNIGGMFYLECEKDPKYKFTHIDYITKQITVLVSHDNKHPWELNLEFNDKKSLENEFKFLSSIPDIQRETRRFLYDYTDNDKLLFNIDFPKDIITFLNFGININSRIDYKRNKIILEATVAEYSGQKYYYTVTGSRLRGMMQKQPNHMHTIPPIERYLSDIGILNMHEMYVEMYQDLMLLI